MQKRFFFSPFFLSLLLVCVLLATSSRVEAITYGYVDTNNTYSNVGAFIVKAPNGQIFTLCSGTLITPNVFLTASHCTQYFTDVLAPLGYTAYVSFDKLIPIGSQTTRKTNLLAVSSVVTNPYYNQSQSDSGDVGVLILQSNVRGITPATLPECGLLDDLAAQGELADAVFTAAGYGLQNRVVGGGQPHFEDANPVPRMYAFSSFNSLTPGYLRLSQNPATGNGGTCYGDSGGPNFLTVDGQQILVAVTTTGDTACRSTNVDYRLDTASAQAFFTYVNSTYGTSIPTSTCQ
ncbi:MAG TPA: trypsin-like serine protease [Pyrinomonadaceae bacterium]|jgi:secreted trypsin-like serine protease